jgi:hypothetical protein
MDASKTPSPPPPPPPPRHGRPQTPAATAPPPPPPQPGPAGVAQGGKKGLSNLTIGIAAGVALLVVVGGGVGIGTAVISQMTSASPSAPDRSPKPTSAVDENDDDEVDESTSVPMPTESTEAAPVPTDPPVVFQSVSGNLVCTVTAVSAVCHQNNIKYTPPSSACSTSLGGATVGVDRRSVYWPCLDVAMEGASTLEYDVPLVAFSFTCSINYDTGVTCYNKDQTGFTMEYYNGISTF